MRDKLVFRKIERELKKIENPEVGISDIDIHIPDIGGSKIILQRHERYIRGDDENLLLGSLNEII